MAATASAQFLPRLPHGLCVSVVSHNQGNLVDRLIADLNMLPPGTVSRTIVTVNSPDDEWQPPHRISTVEVEVIRNASPKGFGANHNFAFQRCREATFAILNPDIRLPQDPFVELTRCLDIDASCDMVAPVQFDAQGHRESFARRVPTPASVVSRRLWLSVRRSREESTAPQWVCGAFMVWRSEAFRRLQGFDERYFLYCEDVDICLRLQLSGRRFAIIESAEVIHDAQRSSRASAAFLLLHLRSLFRLWTSPVFWRSVGALAQPTTVRT